MSKANLMEIKSVGPFFIWSNKRKAEQLILQRLDKGFTNTEWLIKYPETIMSNLAMVGSDHCRLLIDTQGRWFLERKFCRFEEIWLEHPKYRKVIEMSWSKGVHGSYTHTLCRKLALCRHDLIRWIKEEFGRGFDQIKCLGIQSNRDRKDRWK